MAQARTPLHLVLDTNVVASALLWSGSPRILLQAAREKRVRLFSSPPMRAKLGDILARPKFARKIEASLLSVDQLVEGYAALTAVVGPVAIPRIAPDPDDDMVIGTALAAKARAIVTGDQPLLTVDEYQGVRLMTVARALMLAQQA